MTKTSRQRRAKDVGTRTRHEKNKLYAGEKMADRRSDRNISRASKKNGRKADWNVNRSNRHSETRSQQRQPDCDWETKRVSKQNGKTMTGDQVDQTNSADETERKQ